MKYHYSFILLVGFLFFAGQTSSISQPQTISLQAPAIATVGDLFQSTVEGRPGFFIPNTPQFHHTYSLLTPSKYSAFYTMKGGTISLASFMRFITKGHALFSNALDRKTYKQALEKAIEAHKTYSAALTSSTQRLNFLKQQLVDAEVKVFSLLKKIPLTQATTLKLEEMLSTPRPTTFLGKVFSAIGSALFLPGRCKIVQDTNNPSQVYLKKMNPLAQILLQVGVCIVLGLVTTFTLVFNPIILLTGTLNPGDFYLYVIPITGILIFYYMQVIGIIAALKMNTNYKLAPEPYPIRVEIKKQ